MTNHKTHPAGTADLIERLRDEYVAVSRTEAADRIEQLEATIKLKNIHIEMIDVAWDQTHAELTRANAATAAAYEVAARAIMKKCHDDMDRKEEAAIVRALATPDQTAALDKLIAEAEARGMKRAADIADAKYAAGEMGNPGHHILAASKKGGV